MNIGSYKKRKKKKRYFTVELKGCYVVENRLTFKEPTFKLCSLRNLVIRMLHTI